MVESRSSIRIKISAGKGRTQRQASARTRGSACCNSPCKAFVVRFDAKRAAARTAICSPGPLHYRSLDHRRHDLCRLTAADSDQSLDGNSLLGDHAASTEAREAAGERGKSGNGCGQSPRPRFRRELAAVRKIRFRKRSEQRIIVDLGWDEGTVGASCQLVFHRWDGVREKIELLFGHTVMMAGIAGVFNRQRIMPTEKFL